VKQNSQHVFFDLKALRRELEEMAASKKKNANRERQESQEVQGPVLVIRGLYVESPYSNMESVQGQCPCL
jgi:hypothetical protein